MNRFTIFWLLFLPTMVMAQGKVQTGPFPAWIAPVSYSQYVQDTLHSGGYYHLLLEWQVNAESHQTYRRTAIKVLTQKGLEDASSIQVNYDPSYEKLVFHEVIIRRGEEKIDKLKDASAFEILRREQNMDRLIYDKSLDAILNIEDVQVGDVIEYSYTLHGSNPVFKDKFFRKFSLNYGAPIGKIYDRILSKASRPLQFRTFNQAPEPTREERDGLISYTWDLQTIPALLTEDGVPSWFTANQQVEVTEFLTWTEVNAWALPLYSTTSVSSAEIGTKIKAIQSNHLSVESQIKAAIRFVQDEVRYLSFSDGVQGFKPHDPVTVFKQRFGDCKDKSVLLSYLLSKLGVESHPALVNSATGKVLDKSLPIPTLFDHCIVQFNLNDSVYWVDPTMSLERGSFTKSAAANYDYALVISPGTTELSPIHVKTSKSHHIKVYEDYAFKIVGGSASLSVKTTYSGQAANAMRSYWKSNSPEEIKRSYTDFYANDYADVRMVEYVVFEDNEADNVLSTVENYEIDTFWKRDSTTDISSVNFYGRVIANYLNLPSTKSRTMPYAINHPIAVDQTITIHLPEPWTVTESHTNIASAAFTFESETDYIDDKIRLYYSYRSLKDHIDASETKNYLEKIDEATDHVNFQLTYRTNNKTNSASTFNIPFLLIAIFLVPLLFLGMRRLYLVDPRSKDYTAAYDQFGGWLILPVIGIFLNPIYLLAGFIKGGYFNYIHWEILTNPSHGLYNPSLGGLVLFEFVYFLAAIGFSILLILLLIKKRTSFPLFVCLLYGLNVSYLLIETLCLSALDLPTAFASSKEIVSTMSPIFVAIVWIPFFIYSDRVKGTFRERLK